MSTTNFFFGQRYPQDREMDGCIIDWTQQNLDTIVYVYIVCNILGVYPIHSSMHAEKTPSLSMVSLPMYYTSSYTHLVSGSQQTFFLVKTFAPEHSFFFWFSPQRRRERHTPCSCCCFCFCCRCHPRPPPFCGGVVVVALVAVPPLLRLPRQEQQ